LARVAVLVPADDLEEAVVECLTYAVCELGESNVYVVGAASAARIAGLVGRVASNVLEVRGGGKARAVREAVEHFELLERYDAVVIIDGGTLVLPGFGRAAEDGLILPGLGSLWEIEPGSRPKLLLTRANGDTPEKTSAIVRKSGGIGVLDDSVCVLCPAYNEEPVLDRTLMAAAAEVGPRNVYVADDASLDHTAHSANFWTGGNVYTSPQNQGKSRALRGAIDHFALTERYEAVFLLDADTYLSSGHIASLQAKFGPGVAFAVGRIEADWVSDNFWVAYRAFQMWTYNALVRTPQNVLNVINVLPGSSVLISSETAREIDWERASRLVLDDYSMLCDVWYGKLGKIVYLHDTPPADTTQPLSFRAYLKQTYGRWWPGMWQTMRDRRMFTKTDWFSVTNNLQVLTWVWSAALPVTMPLLFWLLNGTVAVFALLITFGLPLAQAYILGGLYAYHTKRPRTLILLPAFVAVQYLESMLFTLGFFKSFRLEQGGRWESPARVEATITERG
jgi:poly-beta-1,6-N-acetyl-D-glucosamine synthase